MEVGKEAEMDTYRVESIHIRAGFERAFGYIAAPENLPHWTYAFKSVKNGRAVMTTPAGTVEVGLQVNSSRPEGTVDWHMKLPDGNEATAYSRLIHLSDEASVYCFVLLAPPVPLEQLEGSLNQQGEILREELKRLSEILGPA
jgi:hypothetical protein